MAVTLQGKGGFTPNFTQSSKTPKYNFLNGKNSNSLVDHYVVFVTGHFSFFVKYDMITQTIIIMRDGDFTLQRKKCSFP